MQMDEKRKLPVSGHESHGVHVCNRCGWPFPNPHPSAKHRRNHKKHCGKIQGFPLVEVSPRSAAAADGDLFEGDHGKPEVEEKGIGSVDLERGGSVRSDEEAVGDLANVASTGTTDADKASDPSFQPNGIQIQGLNIESMLKQMESGTELQNDAVLCAGPADASSLHVRTDSLDMNIPRKGSSDSLFIEASSIYSEEKTETTLQQKMGSSPEVLSGYDAEETNNVNDNEYVPLSKVEALESDAAKIVSKSALTGVVSEKGVPLTCASNILAQTKFGDLSLDSKAIDLNSWLTQVDKIDDMDRHEPDNGPSSDSHNQPLNVDAGEHLKADSVQVENPLVIVGVDMQGNTNENAHIIALLENISERDTSKMTDEVSEKCGTVIPIAAEPTVKPEPDVIAAESVLKPEDNLGDPNHGEIQAHLGSDSTKSSKAATFLPSTMMVQQSSLYREETGGEITTSNLHDNDNVRDEDYEVKFLVVRENYCEPKSDVREVEGVKSHEFEDLENHPGAFKEDSVRSHVISDDPLTSSIPSVESMIEPSIEDEDPCHEISDEAISANSMVGAIAIVNGEVSTQADRTTKVETTGHDIKHEEAPLNHNDIGKDSKIGVQVDDSRPNTEITPETSDVLVQANAPSHRGLENSGMEQKQELSPSDGVFNVATQVNEATRINNGSPDVAHEGSWINHYVVVKECCLEGSKTDYSGTNITMDSHPACDVSEEQLQSPEKLQKIKVEERQELAESILIDSATCLEDIDNTGCLTESISEPRPDQLDHLSKDSTKRQIELASDSDNDQSASKTVQLEQIKAEKGSFKHIKKGSNSFENSTFELGNHDTQLPNSEENATPSESPLFLDESSTNKLTEGDLSITQPKSLQDKNVREHDANTLEWVESSVDIVSQTEALVVNCGSVSDQSAPSTRSKMDLLPVLGIEGPETKPQTQEEARAANLMTGVSAEHGTDDSDLFETSSFMTHAALDRQIVSADLESVQKSQQPRFTSEADSYPSLAHSLQELKGRKENEAIIDNNIADESSGKFHTPLKSLLAEENIGKKQTSPNVQDGVKPLPNHESQSLQDGFPPKAPNLSVTSANDPEGKGAEKTGWSSPARFPVSKNQKKRKPNWVPFLCCSSV